MDITAFISILFALQFLCLFIGGRSSKGMQSQEDYFLAGKGIRFFPLMMTFVATQVGGGVILGAAEEAYQFGWSVLFYPLGAALGLIMLGLGVGRRLAQFKVSTVAQIFELAYRSPFLKKVASLFSILSLFMVFVAQIIASNKFMMSLGLENPLWFFCFWGIVIFYTSVGGLKAVVATDVVQAAFFMGTFLLCFGYAIYTAETPLGQALELGVENSSFVFDSSKLYGWLLMPLLFMTIEQDMGQRCFAANSPTTVSKATFWAGVCTLIVGFVPVFFGVLAKGSGMEIPLGTSVLMKAIMQTTNPLLTALVGCAILVAIISTADSLINAIGSNVSQDFGSLFIKKDTIKLSQALSAGIAVIGILFSFYFNNIVDLLMQSYELSVSCLFVPIAIVLYKREGRALSAGLSVAFGAAGFIILRITPTELPREVFSILLSLLGFCLGEVVVWIGAQKMKRGGEVYE